MEVVLDKKEKEDPKEPSFQVAGLTDFCDTNHYKQYSIANAGP